MQNINRQILLAARPEGFPKLSDFRLVETPMPSVAPGQFLVRSLYLSVDPYMRGRMNDRKSYADPVKIDDVMIGGVVAEVVESQHEKFNPGDIVIGMFGWQEYALSDGKEVRQVRTGSAPASTALGVLGMPGLTAYCGFLEICQPQAGETVVVSGAAGAVGSIVGQIAKLKGCRVVGIAGSDAKVEYLTDELGFDTAFNYKSTDDYYGKLKQLCPDGIDAYFDNVGGPITDAVFAHINTRARIAICGQISQYHAQKLEQGPRLLWKLIEKQAKVEGFLVFQFISQFRPAMQQLTEWVEADQIKYRERITEGLENAPQAFLEMLQGANIGKQLVKIS
ncbi:MAG: NADP-dependent oxidoreductase [Planctomycetes bacterium]|nr:NADP-dependent oxidoreductase [Planctomycetota bacterium]